MRQNSKNCQMHSGNIQGRLNRTDWGTCTKQPAQKSNTLYILMNTTEHANLYGQEKEEQKLTTTHRGKYIKYYLPVQSFMVKLGYWETGE